MTAADFKSWLKTEGLSLTAASDLLGLSRRTIAYYASGERTIPRVVFIACMAVASARKRRRAA
jgi:transcriptional regulator with XRE-family HTH domain